MWQNPDVKLKEGTKSIPGRMRAGRSRAQIQPGKAEMWNGSGDSEAGRYSCACGCSVHSAAESAKDSARFHRKTTTRYAGAPEKVQLMRRKEKPPVIE